MVRRPPRDGIGRLDERFQAVHEAAAVNGRHLREDRLDAAELERVQLVGQGLARRRDLQHVHAPVHGMVAASDEALLFQAVDDVRDRRQRDAEGLADLAHVTARVPGDVEQDLRLRVRQVELRGLLPQELPEGRAAEAREEIDEPLRLRPGVDARTTGAANGQDDTSGKYRRGPGPSRS
jgi:hypothetical protein